MRVVFAAMFVVVAVFAAVVVFDQLSVRIPAGRVAPLTALIFFPVVILALKLFSAPRPRESQIADLESKGLIVEQSFKAVRAFEAEEYEDEGRNYFIELEDGSILFLVGQYLYDYGLSDGDTEADQSHMFPCTEFTIRRHKLEGYVVGIRCGGKGVKPEICVPPLTGKNLDDYCEDGMIIRGETYDALKAKLAQGELARSRRG
jgi:hypothetical protein